MVRRSTLIIPANKNHLLKKDYLQGADAVLLELEDGVHPSEKENARRLIKESIPLAGACGAEVQVRINNDPLLLPLDTEASVFPGLDGIVVPKTESLNEIHNLEEKIGELEKVRGIEPGHIRISILIESPRGLLKAQELSVSSPRIDSLTLAPEDFSQALGVEQSADGMEMICALSWIVIVCKSVGIIPLGRLGCIDKNLGLEGFKRGAVRAMQLGCEGSFCAWPDQVQVLNQIFSPSPESVEFARQVVEAFEKGSQDEIPSLNGKIVDTQVYHRARLILEREQAIAKVEQRKVVALSRFK